MPKRYEVEGEGVGILVCWEGMNVLLSELLDAAKTEFADVSFDDLEIMPGEDGEYLFLQHKYRHSARQSAQEDRKQRRDQHKASLVDIEDFLSRHHKKNSTRQISGK